MPSPPASLSGRRRSRERNRPSKAKHDQSDGSSKRRAGNDSSEDSGPEVEFGAFRRGAAARPLSSLGSNSTGSIYTAATEPRPVVSNGRPSVTTGRMRGGAPRLGGLGLGGLANQATEPSRAAVSSRPQSSSSQKVRRKPIAQRLSDNFPAREPPVVSPFPALSNSTSTVDVTSLPPMPRLVSKKSMSNIERPFLSAELPVTTVRTSAFALDRPVPDSGLRSTPPAVDVPESPFPSGYRLLARQESDDSLTRTMDAPLPEESEKGFGLLQAALAEEMPAKEVLRTPKPSQSESDIPSSPMDPTPPTARPTFESDQFQFQDDEMELLASTPMPPLSPQFNPHPLILTQSLARSSSSSSEDSVTSPATVHPYRTSTSSNATSDTTDSVGPRTPPPASPLHRYASSPLVRIADDEGADIPIERQPSKTVVDGSSRMSRSISDDSSADSFRSGTSETSAVCQVALHVALPLPPTSRAHATGSPAGNRSRGPPPPRPKRLRLPASDVVAPAVAIAGAAGLVVRTRGVFDDGRDIEDDGGGGGGAGASLGPPSRGYYQPGSGQSSNGSSEAGLSRPSSRTGSSTPGKPSPNLTIPIPVPRPTLASLRADKKAKDQANARPSPEMPNSPASFVSTSASEAGSVNESFFFRPPPVRGDATPVPSPPAAVVTPPAVATPLISPPLVDATRQAAAVSPTATSPSTTSTASTPSMSPTTVASPATTSYFGLGLRLPSSLRASASLGSSQALRSPPLDPSPRGVPALALSSVAATSSPTSPLSPIAAPLHSLPPLPLPALPLPDLPLPPLPPVVLAAPPPVVAARPPSPVAPVTPAPTPYIAPPVEVKLAAVEVKLAAVELPRAAEPEPFVLDESFSAMVLASDAPAAVQSRSISAAAASVVVSGGYALGYGAWRGLATAASVGGSSLSWGWRRVAEVSAAVEVPPVPVAEPVAEFAAPAPPPSTKALGKRRQTIVPGSFDLSVMDTEDEESAGEEEPFYSEDEAERSTLDEVDFDRDDKSSSIVETEWGEMHFPAPEGFLEDFRKAMEDVGPEDFEADERAAALAQQAAYESANRAHNEAASSPFSVASELDRLAEPTSPSTSSQLRRLSSSSNATLRDRQRVGSADEMEELSDSKVDWPRLSRDGSLRANSGSPASTRSIVSSRSFSAASTASTGGMKGSLFGFGSGRRSRVTSETASILSASPSTPSTLERTFSITSSGSGSQSKKRSSIFSAPKVAPSVESDIGDATYVNYSSGKAKRRTSGASSAASIMSRGDSPGASETGSIRGLGDSRSRRDRRSSLRRESRYETSKAIGLSDTIEESVEPLRKSMYSVRFANAASGLGLKSVAESEAVLAGGESFGMRWTGVGRGRYGNLLLISDADADTMYAEQALQIKRKFRAYGVDRNWSQVKID